MTTAFQRNTFQNNAFQIVIARGGSDTSDPLYYDWWRKRRKDEEEPEQPPVELIAEVAQLISAPITRTTPISPELIRALAGQAEAAPSDGAAMRARAIAELKRIAQEEQDEDEAIMLLMLQ